MQKSTRRRDPLTSSSFAPGECTLVRKNRGRKRWERRLERLEEEGSFEHEVAIAAGIGDFAARPCRREEDPEGNRREIAEISAPCRFVGGLAMCEVKS